MRFVRGNGQTNQVKQTCASCMSPPVAFFGGRAFYDPWHVYRTMAQCASHAWSWCCRRLICEVANVRFNPFILDIVMLVGDETYVVTDLPLNTVFKCCRNIQVVINKTGVNTV
jgi:hypothetical protein